MADIKHVIEPERFGIWIAVTFVIALLALVMAFIAIDRADESAMVTQTEILLLNKKIEGSQPAVAAPTEAEAVAE
jgi:hypothetical protein